MRKLSHLLHRFFDAAQSRFRKARPGSVMILVVTLLVLMALIGTAFISTARTDRYATAQHSVNTQIDLLIEGLRQLVAGAINNPSPTRPDHPNTDTFLAARTPTRMVDACGAWSPTRVYNRGEWIRAGVNSYMVCKATTSGTANTTFPAGDWLADPLKTDNSLVWESVSAPLVGAAEDISTLTQFDGAIGRHLVEITATPTGSPALRYYDSGSNSFKTVIAASSSGDGIADSFLWRMPIGDLNGVTYYASARVIDNNSAINLNTANAYLGDFDANGNTKTSFSNINLTFFPSNIGLGELLFTFPATTSFDDTASYPLNPSASLTNYSSFGTEFDVLNRFRFTGQVSSYVEPDGITSAPTTPVDDNGNLRNDFRYLNVGDALYMGLGRRIDNPARAISGAVPGSAFGAVQGPKPGFFSGFSWADSAALAHRFDLTTLGSNLSNAESLLKPSLVINTNFALPTTAYGAADFVNWYQSNYQYYAPYVVPFPVAGGPSYAVAFPTPFPLAPPNISWVFNRRPLFVARNPILNRMPAHLLEEATPTTVLPAAARIPVTSANIYGQAMGYNGTTATPRVSLNTADITTFDNTVAGIAHHTPTLWLGFYNAMYEAFSYPYAQDTGHIASEQPSYSGGFVYPPQFRSPIRDPRPTNQISFSGGAMLLIRSLIAAVNAKDMRDTDDDVTHVDIPLAVNDPSVSGGSRAVDVTVYGLERQPFITEIYANNDTTVQTAAPNTTRANPAGYVAIELHNPYKDRAISLKGYTLAIMNRSAATYPNAPSMQFLPVPGFSGFGTQPAVPTAPACERQAPIIPAGGYIVLENYFDNTRGYINQDPTQPPILESSTVASPADATFRPIDAYAGLGAETTAMKGDYSNPITPINPTAWYVPNLSAVLASPLGTALPGPGGELYLLRPRRADGFWLGIQTPPTFANPMTNRVWYENTTVAPPVAHYADMVPVDQFDFSGMAMGLPGSTVFHAWHYARASGDGAPWKFVYPGRWTPVNPITPESYAYISHFNGALPVYAIGVSIWDTNPVNGTTVQDSWITTPPHGAGNGTVDPNTVPITLGIIDPVDSSFATYFNPYGPIQLNNVDFPGPNKLTRINYGTRLNQFPFGGFARVGDVLKVPFIGAYTVFDATTLSLLEMHSVTADCSFADDLDPADDANEQVGHLASINLTVNDPTSPQYGQYGFDSSSTPPQYFVDPNRDRYGWAAHVMDYFSALSASSPSDNTLPQADNSIDLLLHHFPPHDAVFNPTKYSIWDPDIGNYISELAPSPVPIASTAPIEGQININTVNWRVLSEVPFNPSNPRRNADIAYAIINHRNVNGPFTSISDLNRVILVHPSIPGRFATFASATSDPALVDFGANEGDYSPGPPAAPDGVINDFEQRYAALTRVSNLLTTRSDSFTVYIQIQGYRGISLGQPELVAKRSAAFIVDRSTGTPKIMANIQTE